MAAHEQGGGRSYDRFYPISIAVKGECGDDRAVQLGLIEAIFLVIHKIIVGCPSRVAAG